MADNEHIADLQRYPVLTSETSPLAARRAGAPGAPLGQTVEQALYETLGWRPRISDPRGFVAALSQSFASKEEEGQILWEWMPHTYAVQADLGAVTGAQASIYKQATVIRGESLPLLEGLEPLRADYDEEDTEASRAIVESNLSELVDELGQVGGPRVQRVDTLFGILLNVGPNDPTPGEPERVNGQLGNLRERFGLERERVNTIEEEQNLTNYLVLVDYVLSLRRTWLAQRHFFDRQGTDVYLGTQLVLISRALASLVESVYEARDAMDSVFLGEAERQTIELSLEGETNTITIAELLAWAERFGSEEGPRLIREGGKEGVRVIRPTMERLGGLLRSAWELTQESGNPVRGFHTPRVQRTFEELTSHAERIIDLASQIDGASLIKSVEPSQGSPGSVLDVTIHGENFGGKKKRWNTRGRVDFGAGQGITVIGVTKVRPKELTVHIEIAGDAALGMRDVRVTNLEGKSFIKRRAFEVIKAGPSIGDWETEASEALQKVNGALDVLASALKGKSETVVEAIDVAFEELKRAIQRRKQQPQIEEISPAQVVEGQWDGVVAIVGSNLDAVQKVVLERDSRIVDGQVSRDRTAERIRANFRVEDVTEGDWRLIVLDQNDEQIADQAFTVLPPLEVTGTKLLNNNGRVVVELGEEGESPLTFKEADRIRSLRFSFTDDVKLAEGGESAVTVTKEGEEVPGLCTVQRNRLAWRPEAPGPMEVGEYFVSLLDFPNPSAIRGSTTEARLEQEYTFSFKIVPSSKNRE